LKIEELPRSGRGKRKKGALGFCIHGKSKNPACKDEGEKKNGEGRRRRFQKFRHKSGALILMWE